MIPIHRKFCQRCRRCVQADMCGLDLNHRPAIANDRVDIRKHALPGFPWVNDLSIIAHTDLAIRPRPVNAMITVKISISNFARNGVGAVGGAASLADVDLNPLTSRSSAQCLNDLSMWPDGNIPASARFRRRVFGEAPSKNVKIASLGPRRCVTSIRRSV